MSMHERTSPQRLIVAITGASGVIYGIRAMETLAKDATLETHLILTAAARATIAQETDWKARDVEALASVVHPSSNIGASIASGSFETMGMLVAPCSIKTLSAIANSYSAELVARAADVQRSHHHAAGPGVLYPPEDAGRSDQRDRRTRSRPRRRP
jgi:4-hydroxy-3-polyprenylbenzoate decarboxylase